MTRRSRAPRAQDKPSRVDPFSLVLPERLAGSLLRGHPWIYRTHVPQGVRYPSGTWVEVRAGGFRGYGLWDEKSPIALRMFSRLARPDAGYFRERIKEALSLRAPLRRDGTNAFRLLFGEADGVPGLTVDAYDRHCVLVTYAESLDAIVGDVVSALRELLPLDGILRRRVRAEDSSGIEVLWGSFPETAPVVSEHGVRLRADLRHGQKTGLFLDHRENRLYVQKLVEERGLESVLNLFSYTGAFSVYAALGGARAVTSVDVARPAVTAARDNFALNGVDPEQHQFLATDVFTYLEESRSKAQKFDLVIADPPSFATAKDQQSAALRAYTRLHAQCLGVTRAGGFYAAASCTAQVSPEAFRETLAEGAARARVRLQIIYDVGQPFDHPVLAGHVEGRYLKFMVGRVLERS